MTAFEVAMVAGMTLVTFAVRYPLLVLVGRLTMPPALQIALRYVPPAVLSAIVVPAMLYPDGDSLHLHYTNSFLAAGLISALVAWRSGNLLLTIGIGMLSLWALRWIGAS